MAKTISIIFDQDGKCLQRIGLSIIFFLMLSSKSIGQVDSIFELSYIYACFGDTLNLELPDSLDDPNYNYKWTLEGGSADSTINNSIYPINDLGIIDTGRYYCEIIMPTVPLPDTTIYGPFYVLPYTLDLVGGKYIPNQLIVKYEIPAPPESLKEAIRDTFNAERIDSCTCDGIELWELLYPITFIDENGMSIVITLENAMQQMRDRAEIKEVEFNYITEGYKKDNTNSKNNISPLAIIEKKEDYQKEIIEAGPLNVIKIAVIDNGIDPKHQAFKGTFRENPSDLLTNNIDDDLNCLINDISGYDFFDDDLDANPVIGDHGTHVAGIIDSVYHEYKDNADTRLEFINIRSLGSAGDGTLFDLICGVNYAVTENADIVNMSLGYRGQYRSLILEFEMKAGSNDCGTIFVTSAGNERADNEVTPHWPSNFNDRLKNVISVGAIDSIRRETDGTFIDTGQSSGYTNFGNNVDIGTKGIWTSTVLNNNFGEKMGTSMSAAYVSGVLAVLKESRPEAKWDILKQILLENMTISESSLNQTFFEGRVLHIDLINGVKNILANLNLDSSTACDFTSSISNQVEPELFTIQSPYPNPSNYGFTFPFTLKQSAEMEIRIFDALGRQVYMDANFFSPGKWNYYWDKNDGKHLENTGGIYFYTFKINEYFQSGKLILTK